MTIAHCPNCREQVSVPSGVSRQARVRCPLCTEEYLLDDALRSLPPLLIVVHDPEAQASEELPESPLMPSAFARRDTSEAPPIVIDEGSEELAFEPAAPTVAPAFKFESPAVPTPRNPSVTARPRARHKETGPLRFMVQTVAGGVMGLVIAQLILWWMPGNWHESKRDPFGLAAKVVPYAPYLVPTMLRGNAPTALGKGPANSADSSRTGTSSAPKNNTGRKNSGSFESNIPEFAIDANTPAESSKEPNPDSLPNLTPDPFSVSPKSQEEMKKESPTGGLDDVPASVVAEKPTLNEPLGLRNPPRINIEEITARLADVTSAELAWDTAENPSREQKVEFLTEIYAKLAELGNAVAVVSTTQPEAAVPLQPTVVKLTTLAAQPEKLINLGKYAGIWLTEHHDEGAVLVGVVLSHRPRGKLFETQIRLNAKSNPVMSVISTTDLADQLPLETTVLVLGRLVSAPEKNLTGYEGNADSVLLHGVHVTVPETKPKP